MSAATALFWAALGWPYPPLRYRSTTKPWPKRRNARHSKRFATWQARSGTGEAFGTAALLRAEPTPAGGTHGLITGPCQAAILFKIDVDTKVRYCLLLRVKCSSRRLFAVKCHSSDSRKCDGIEAAKRGVCICCLEGILVENDGTLVRSRAGQGSAEAGAVLSAVFPPTHFILHPSCPPRAFPWTALGNSTGAETGVAPIVRFRPRATLAT